MQSSTSPSRSPAKPTPPEVRPLLVYLQTERGLAKNSIEAYRRDLSDLALHLQEQAKNLQTANADDFRLYLQKQSTLRNPKGELRSTKTVTRRLAAIRVYLKYCEAIGQDKKAILDQLERPKPERDLPHVLSETIVSKLIGAPKPEHRFFTRDVAILELLYAAGLRASELCTLTLRDTNLTVGAVRVFGKGAKERVVPIGRASIEALKRYLEELRPLLLKGMHSDYVFVSRAGKPIERVALWQIVKKHAKTIGMKDQVTTHVLRHCFATHLISGGADLRIVQELLGHSDVTTTQIYTHVDGKRLRAVHKKFHPRG
ncbi:MAG: tyrosine recombinase [Tepidisphaeraceae bacterium]